MSARTNSLPSITPGLLLGNGGVMLPRPYGGRGYTGRDPEGHVWAFGSYDPWAE